MGIASWWYGPASINYEPSSELMPETHVDFGGQTLLQSHYQEIRKEFEAACDEVRLYRIHNDSGYARSGEALASLAPDPNDADQAVLEALTLVGYIDGVQYPVIRFDFGSKRPGVLWWDHFQVTNPNAELQAGLRRSALSDEHGLPPGFEDMVAERSEKVARRLSGAYEATKRRVLEAGHGRSTPWRRWAMLAGVGSWALAAGLLLWLILGSEAPLPALLIAAVALATSARSVQVRVHSRLRVRHQSTWQQGPVRLRWTTRTAVREARANSRRDIWVGFIGSLIGAALAWLTWLVQQ
ncbi:hypothetical protein [Promicromonospora sp. NPDC023805]|uniref:hypothetical protein n=1 Tax=Promicromonospora sp. NPDC023805 TaxID=3154696 RepID=UPI0033E7B13A